MSIDVKRDLSLVSIGTAIVYLTSYFFQYGIFKYYTAPVELISIDINSLLFSAVVVAVIIFLIFIPAYIYHDIICDNGAENKARVMSLLICYCMFVFFYTFILSGLPNQKITLNVFNLSGVFYLFLSALFHAFVLLSTLAFKYGAPIIKGTLPKEFKYIVIVFLSPSIVFFPMISGMYYAKVGVANFKYNDSEYYLMTENSKGIIVAKCDSDNGMSFKRLDATPTYYKTIYDNSLKDKEKKCINKWNEGGLKLREYFSN